MTAPGERNPEVVTLHMSSRIRPRKQAWDEQRGRLLSRVRHAHAYVVAREDHRPVPNIPPEPGNASTAVARAQPRDQRALAPEGSGGGRGSAGRLEFLAGPAGGSSAGF